MRRYGWLITGFLFGAFEARGCGVCADQMLAVGAPYIVPVFVIFLGWLGASFVFHGPSLQEASREIKVFPSAKGALRVLGTTVIVMGVLWVLSQGSSQGPMILVLLVWIPSIVIRTLLFILNWVDYRDRTHPRLRAAFLGLQCLTLLLVVAAVPLSLAAAHTPEGLTSVLGYTVTDRNDAVRRLIAQREAAVPALINTARRGLDNPADYGNPCGLAVHCLGWIGGAEARVFLGEVLRTKVDFQKNEMGEAEWQRAVCFAYARAAGADVARDLIALYQKCDGEVAAKERWAILVALVIGGGEAGHGFVMSHLEELLDAAESRASKVDSALAGAAVAGLLGAHRPAYGDLPTARACDFRRIFEKPTAGEYRDNILERIGKKDYSLRALWREFEKGRAYRK